jgi:hypothetical protein
MKIDTLRETLNSHEFLCMMSADHFSAVRGRTIKDRKKATFKTIEEAESFAAKFGDGRTMIYAVTKSGHSAHIRNA